MGEGRLSLGFGGVHRVKRFRGRLDRGMRVNWTLTVLLGESLEE